GFAKRKRHQFWEAVRADPTNFVERAAHRFLGATVWYVPFDRHAEARRPWSLWLGRLTHPLPFLALLALLFTAVRERLHAYQWAVLAVYALYLLPYVGVSYYERYAVPLLGAKVLLVVWAADRLLPGRRGAPTSLPAPPAGSPASSRPGGSASPARA